MELVLVLIDECVRGPQRADLKVGGGIVQNARSVGVVGLEDGVPRGVVEGEAARLQQGLV